MSLFSETVISPLPERMRPKTLDDLVGQDALLGPGTSLREMLESGKTHSMILWGPPGVGKTTLARLLASLVDAEFVSLSAVTSGVKEARELIEAAGKRRRLQGRQTILFVDEIHRFNKAQQDAFLPCVESGDILFVGATTENPSFEVIAPLLSRCTVYVLEPLTTEALRTIVAKALAKDGVLKKRGMRLAPDAEGFLLRYADGDARVALNLLEWSAESLPQGENLLTADRLRDTAQSKSLLYDKTGEEHYNLISALHKSIRNSDPHAALYWLTRMLEGGEDPLYLARRLVRAAYEDVGLADPRAAEVAMTAKDAAHFMGMPECNIALAEAALYLALAPKSNAVYRAYGAAQRDVRTKETLPVPLAIRNAPTKLMKNLGYGKNYRYAHNEENGVAKNLECLPENLHGAVYYCPKETGFEIRLKKKLEWLKKLKK